MALHSLIALDGDVLTLDVEGVAPARIDLGPAQPRAWGMEEASIPLVAGVPRQGVCALRSVYEGAYDLVHGVGGTGRDGADLWPIKARLRAVAREVVAACDPAALAVARRFPTGTRLRIYTWLRADCTGRLAQLAATCPGAILLAVVATEEWHFWDESKTAVAAARGIVADAQAGVKLRTLVGRAVEALTPGASAEARRDLAVLVRRSGPRVPPGYLAGPPPAIVIPEDIPAGVRANVRWFRAVCGIPRRRGREPSAPLVALARLVSAQYQAMANLVTPARGYGRFGVALAEYVVATGRCPPRELPLGRLLDESRAWRLREVAQAAAIARAAAAAQDRELPPPPDPGVEERWLAIRPLATPAALWAEGMAMHHCVGLYAGQLRAGLSAFYAVTVGNARMTLELHRTGSGWSLAQLKGVGNRLPTEDEYAALGPWLGHMVTLTQALSRAA